MHLKYLNHTDMKKLERRGSSGGVQIYWAPGALSLKRSRSEELRQVPTSRNILRAFASCNNPSVNDARMVYDWDDKLDDAYRLYVEEHMNLDQVMEWFRREKGFAPRYVFSPP